MAEPEQYFVSYPFAQNGDRESFPDSIDPSGEVSFSQGFGPDYERNPEDDPNAKRIPRDKMNQLFYLAFLNIRQYQLAGYAQFVSAQDNAGKAVVYPYGARVRHDDKVYASVIDNNQDTPGTTENWVLDDPFSFEAYRATLAETLAGITDEKIITPEKFVQATREQPFAYAVATGTANYITAAFQPELDRYTVGLFLHVRVAQANTGAVVFDGDGLGPIPVKDMFGNDLPANALRGGSLLSIMFTGDYFAAVNYSLASRTNYGVVRLATDSDGLNGQRQGVAMTPKSTASQLQGGKVLYAGAASGSSAEWEITLDPVPAEVGPGSMFSFLVSASNAAGVTLKTNASEPQGLHWADGGAISEGELEPGISLTVINTGTDWRIVNNAAATSRRKGIVRIADQATLNAGSDSAAAVPVSLFAGGVRNTLLSTLTTALDQAITAKDSVLSAFGKLQAQVNNRGVLKGSNLWSGNNYFDAGVLAIRAGESAEKGINFRDTGTNAMRGRLAAMAQAVYLAAYGGGVQLGERLQFNGVQLALSGRNERRFINRSEAATIEQVAAQESWETYVTPASLAGVKGTQVGSAGIFTVFTSGRARWAFASGSRSGKFDVPAGMFASATPIAGNGAIATFSLQSGKLSVTSASYTSGGGGGGSGANGNSNGGRDGITVTRPWTVLLIGVAGSLEVSA